MLRTIYVQILLIMTTACSAMEEFEISKSRKFSYLDRDIAFLLGHNYQLYSLKIDLFTHQWSSNASRYCRPISEI